LTSGAQRLRLGVVDGNGRVLAKAECPTDVPRGFDHAMQRVIEMLAQSTSQSGVELQGIGIGCTGPVDPLTGALGDVNTLPGWEGGNPVRKLSAEFRLPVAMENDADAAVLGEAIWGSGKGKARLICVTIGTGIGAGVVLEGRSIAGLLSRIRKSGTTSSKHRARLALAVRACPRDWRVCGTQSIASPPSIRDKSRMVQ